MAAGESTTRLDPEFEKIVAAGRDLLAGSELVPLQKWAARSGVASGIIRQHYFGDPQRRLALEQALNARCVDAEGGCFLIKP